MGFAAVCNPFDARAQGAGAPIPGVGAEFLEDIAAGSRTLAELGVLDGFGHVSARHPANPQHFLMARSLAPALVTPTDIMEFDLDGTLWIREGVRCSLKGSSIVKSLRLART
jgi:HCOMODA/2-hydroxy-3-carboxy-muconic semialdehyde decarboxylase